MSFALVAAARAARQARRRDGVTCVRVPARPLEPAPEAGVTVTPAIAAAPAPAIALDDPPTGQPTAVMPAVTAPAAARPPADLEATPARVEAALPPAAEPTPASAPACPSLPQRPPLPERPPAPARHAPLEPLPSPDPSWGWSEPWSFELPAPDAPDARVRRAAPRRQRTRRRPARRPARRGHPAVALAVIVLAVAISAWIVIPRSAPASAHPTRTADLSQLPTPRPSAFALRAIPAAYLHDYWRAAAEYGLDWTKLAAVGQIESDQGRSRVPGVGAGTNPAGAAGPAQFLHSTWARYGVDADGRGSMNPYDPADAITAMAAYLKASGAPEDWRAALFTYNHSSAYVDSVLALSRRYLGP